MGRKKIEFTKEQDERITQLVSEGYSLNQILPIINGEFNSSFSRSGIDRRIKTLGIDRGKINVEVKSSISKSDIIKYIINKSYYNSRTDYEGYRVRLQFTLDQFSKRIGVSKPTLLKHLKKYNLPNQITPDMKEFFDISNLDLRMYKKETVDDIVAYLESKTNVVIERNPVIKVGNTDITVELYFPEYKSVLVCGLQDDYYTTKLGESELPIRLMDEWYTKISNESNYKCLYYRLEYNTFMKRPTRYDIKYVGDSIIKDLGLSLKEL